MKPSKISLFCIALALTGCSSLGQPVDQLGPNPTVYEVPEKPRCPVPAKKPAPKNPLNVSIYPKGTLPEQPYKVIAVETVSKYNLGGIKRHKAGVNDALRKVAASVGGDAVIDLQYGKKTVTGKVITYEDTSLV